MITRLCQVCDSQMHAVPSHDKYVCPNGHYVTGAELREWQGKPSVTDDPLDPWVPWRSWDDYEARLISVDDLVISDTPRVGKFTLTEDDNDADV